MDIDPEPNSNKATQMEFEEPTTNGVYFFFFGISLDFVHNFLMGISIL